MDYEVKGIRPGGRPKKTQSAVVKKKTNPTTKQGECCCGKWRKLKSLNNTHIGREGATSSK